MIPVVTFAGKTVAVFGLGGSGLASCRALLAGGANIIAWDDNAASVEAAVAQGIPTGDLRVADWNAIDALLLAPGVPLTHPVPHWSAVLANAHGKEIVGDIELFCRERRRRTPRSYFVAITGTNGKSTTTALVAHLLGVVGFDVQLGGNIGTPILSLEPPAEDRIHVIECSSYQIDLAPTLDPLIGILTNVTEDHLERHGTMENYAAVKERLVAGVPPRDGTAVIGVDDAYCAAAADRVERSGKRVTRVSVVRPLADGLYADSSRIVQAQGGTMRVIADLTGINSLRGVHNAQNAACAIGALLALGVVPEIIQEGLRSFPGLVHRMEELGHVGRVSFINDSKATNVDSAAKALVCFPDIFWIAGGKPKTGGIVGLAEFFPQIRKAYLIGEAATEFADTLAGKVTYEMSRTLDIAVAAAARDAAASGLPAPVVLLSPACASFDQYRNFEVRGDAFRKLVLALSGLSRKG